VKILLQAQCAVSSDVKKGCATLAEGTKKATCSARDSARSSGAAVAKAVNFKKREEVDGVDEAHLDRGWKERQ
jgi:hypothetical protein